MTPPREPGMWQQFRYRRVTRTAAAYLAVAFAVVEAAWSVAPALDWPDWGTRAVLGALVLGFPAAVVLAWTYDVTPRGIVRTPDELGPEPAEEAPLVAGWSWWVLTTGAVLGGLALQFLRSG